MNSTPTSTKGGEHHMADILNLQGDDEDPDTAEEEKASNVSYAYCANSYTSQFFCRRW
ncbi:MAG: hypothetical protein ACK5MT_13845 [Actinomycetales bacterium]